MGIKFFVFFIIFCISAYAEFKTRVIINPKSGIGSKNIEQTISKYLDNPEIIYTQEPHQAISLSREAANLGYDVVVAVGGDGTINEVGKGLIGSNTAMGIIPSGSGNGLARHLGIPLTIKEACRIIKNNNISYIDTIQINNDYFWGIAGIEFDAHIAWMFANSTKRGFKTYAKLAWKDFLRYKPQIFEMCIDGKTIEKQGLLISFANSSQYGNDIKINPEALLDDGYLEVIIFQKPPFYILPGLLKKLKNGTINTSRYYESIKCKEVHIKKEKIKAHIDGEPIFFEKGIDLKVLPKSLKVVTPE